MVKRYLAYGAHGVIDDDRIILRVSHGGDNGELVEHEFDIEPFALQLANQLLGTVVEQSNMIVTDYTQLEVRKDVLELRTGDDMEVLVSIHRTKVQMIERDFRKAPAIRVYLGGATLNVSYSDRNDGGEECANDYDDVQKWLGGQTA